MGIFFAFIFACGVAYLMGKRSSTKSWEQGIIDAKKVEMLNRYQETMYIEDVDFRFEQMELYNQYRRKGDPVISSEEMRINKETFDEMRASYEKNAKQFNQKVLDGRNRLKAYFTSPEQKQ